MMNEGVYQAKPWQIGPSYNAIRYQAKGVKAF